MIFDKIKCGFLTHIYPVKNLNFSSEKVRFVSYCCTSGTRPVLWIRGLVGRADMDCLPVRSHCWSSLVRVCEGCDWCVGTVRSDLDAGMPSSIRLMLSAIRRLSSKWRIRQSSRIDNRFSSDGCFELSCADWRITFIWSCAVWMVSVAYELALKLRNLSVRCPGRFELRGCGVLADYRPPFRSERGPGWLARHHLVPRSHSKILLKIGYDRARRLVTKKKFV
jgi:hypothetical protein